MLREKNNLTQKEFAKLIGVSQGNVGDWERGRSLPGTSVLIKIVNQFNVSADWLLTGKSNLIENPRYKIFDILDDKELNFLKKISRFILWDRDNEDVFTQHNVDNTISNYKLSKGENEVIYIPYIGNAAAGDPLEIIEYPEGKLPVENKSSYYNAFVVKAKGDSMIGAGIHDEDLVIVRPQPVVENGEMALVDINNEATIKYFYVQNGQVELRPANLSYKSMIYPLQDNKIKVKGKIIGVIKKEDAEKNMKAID